MAEVLAAHQPDDSYGTLHDHCTCGWLGKVMAYDFVPHQSAALTAAGFGLVADAKREALEEAAQAWWLRDDVQDRFTPWSWLLDRAAAVRGEG
jgi:hypothetical protein